jgi:ABC-type Fe3+/spermidine/putrescine transport system ATPase subunit
VSQALSEGETGVIDDDQQASRPAGAAGDVAVALKGVTKTLGGKAVLKNCDLTVRKGELVSILGPSGVGKSTVLNVVAGFAPVEEGTVELAGRDVTWTPANRRNIGFIFQEYALFPHLTVAENVRFPLDMRRVPGRQARERVDAALASVGLESYAARRPNALSGGQRQRVAIARALVFEPDVLLMDEPLSSLDRQLRDEMTMQMRRLHVELGVTVLYVTHDPAEALGLSDRVGVLRDGAVAQIGSPSEVHEQPRSAYVAELCGAVNVMGTCEILPGRGAGDSSPWRAECRGRVVVASRGPDPESSATGALLVGVRPHHVSVAAGDGPVAGAEGAEVNELPGTVESIRLIGSGLRYEVNVATERPWQVVTGRAVEGIEPGSAVTVRWRAEDTMLMEP